MGCLRHRKIDIQYLQDDRVRKVTFCKRKGGLFKKADDLAKLTGVEVAVIIIQENDKTCTYASTDLDRVMNRYKSIHGQIPQSTEQETINRLYRDLEQRRRELEEVQRQLLQERKKVEAFVGHENVQMLTVRPVDMAQMVSPGSAFAGGALNTTQPQHQLTASMGDMQQIVPQGDDSDDEEEPAVKKQRLDTLPVAVPVGAELN